MNSDDLSSEERVPPTKPGGLLVALETFASRTAGLMLDRVFPPQCAGCGRMLARDGALCKNCWSGIRFIERPYCDILGLPFSYDLGPDMVSAQAIANPPDFDRLRSVCHFEGVARRLVHGLKYKDKTELADMMALWMVRAGEDVLAKADGLLPVPLHPVRMLSRRFNQAAELAKGISARTGVPILADTLRRRKNTKRQVGLKRTAREANIRGAFSLTDEGLRSVFGKRIVIVDDVFTTGATVSAVARILKKAGAENVSVLAFATALPDII